MGEAMVASFLHTRILRASEITIVDRFAPRLTQLHRHYTIHTTTDIQAGLQNADIVILAVKPQDCLHVLREVGAHISKHALIISIMAGVSMKTIKKYTRHERIVRSMPNTPAQLQQGMTVWIASAHVSREQKQVTKKIFSAFGKQLEVSTENLVDAATAVSGSGPAYLFAFVEYWISAARHIGFSQEDATLLVMQTLRGSALLLDQSTDDVATLRAKVTSKKGTTDAAMNMFRKEKLDARISKGVNAAYKRAKELSKLIS